MKIIYSGGWDKHNEESRQRAFIYTYQMAILEAFKQNKKIAFVTLAKPDGRYDNLLLSLYEERVNIIDSTKLPSVKWATFDGIFLLGGDTMTLFNNLVKSNFSLRALKKDCVLLGNSAGAYVLSSYFYDSPPGPERGIKIRFVEGFNPEPHVITIAHKNNPFYSNDMLIEKVNTFAKEKNLRVLILNENEQKILVNNEFVHVDLLTLFN